MVRRARRHQLHDSVGDGPGARRHRHPVPTLIPTPAPAKVGVAGVRFESGNLGGTRVTVPQGSEVDIYVTLESTAPTEGLLEVLVLRDIILDADLGKKLCTNLGILSTGSQEI